MVYQKIGSFPQTGTESPKKHIYFFFSAEIEEIWVPTQFNYETFSKAGVNASKLSVVPELTDIHHFDPKGHSPLFSSQKSKDAPYTFLSIMKWEERKAWKSLFGYEPTSPLSSLLIFPSFSPFHLFTFSYGKHSAKYTVAEEQGWN
jgi:hypothetical protein